MIALLDLPVVERRRIALEAGQRTRYLWPRGNDANLAHAVWQQLLLDILNPRHHTKALADWMHEGSLWYIESFGLSRSYLHQLLAQWGFLGDKLDIDWRPHAELEGDKWCRDCDQTLPKAMFNRDRSRPDSLSPLCKTCYAISRGRVSEGTRKS